MHGFHIGLIWHSCSWAETTELASINVLHILCYSSVFLSNEIATQFLFVNCVNGLTNV